MSNLPILIDNNALADFFIGEEAIKKDAENLRRKYPLWVTTPLCRYEFGNVLRTVSASHGALTVIRSGGHHVSIFSGASIAGRLPLARQQLGDAASGMIHDSRHHITKILQRVDPAKAAVFDDRVKDR